MSATTRFTNLCRFADGLLDDPFDFSVAHVAAPLVALAPDTVKPPTREVTLDRLGCELPDGCALIGSNLLRALVDGLRNGDSLGGHKTALFKCTLRRAEVALV